MEILELMSQAPSMLADKLANNSSLKLRISVEEVAGGYLKELNGRIAAEAYEHVIAKVEKPLLEVVLAFVRHNQCKAAEILGISRGTLRKKMKKYGML